MSVLQGEKILLVEDNVITADTISLFLESEGATVVLAHNGILGLEAAENTDFDAAILDWMMPAMDGLTLCKKLRETQSLPIIMLTAKTSEEDIIAGLEAGADDYILKPFLSRELLARLHSALRRRHSFTDNSRDVISLGDLQIHVDQRSVRVNQVEIELTRNEFNILKCLASQPGRIFTRDQLIRSALGADFDGFDRTVDAHISNLRKKLGEGGGVHRHIQTEVGIGYRFQS
jgi:two-component system response regulator RegX3